MASAVLEAVQRVQECWGHHHDERRDFATLMNQAGDMLHEVACTDMGMYVHPTIRTINNFVLEVSQQAVESRPDGVLPEAFKKGLLATATQVLQWFTLLQTLLSSAPCYREAIAHLDEEIGIAREQSSLHSQLTLLRETIASFNSLKGGSEPGCSHLENVVVVCSADVHIRSLTENVECIRGLQRVNIRLQNDLSTGSQRLRIHVGTLHATLGALANMGANKPFNTSTQEQANSVVQQTPCRKKSAPVRRRPPSRLCPSTYRSEPESSSGALIRGNRNERAVPSPTATHSLPPELHNASASASSPDTMTASHPTAARALRSNHVLTRNSLTLEREAIRIGTLNLNGLSKNSMTRKLRAAATLMDRERVRILAVQETRLRTREGANEYLEEFGYCFMQHPARETVKLRLSSGTGFIVHTSVAGHFSWVDIRNPHPYTTRWGRLDLPDTPRCLFVGCIYLPDSSRRQLDQNEFQQSLAILRSDILRFRAEGEVLILGDFNVQVGTKGCSKSAEVFGDIPPRYGTSMMTPRYGKDILHLVQDTQMCFLSGSEPEHSPQTFQRVSLRRGTVSCSVIDHIIGSPDLKCIMSTTRTLSFDTAEIKEGNFDHTMIFSELSVANLRKDCT